MPPPFDLPSHADTICLVKMMTGEPLAPEGETHEGDLSPTCSLEPGSAFLVEPNIATADLKMCEKQRLDE